MNVLVLAENDAAARDLCAGAYTLADEVSLVVFDSDSSLRCANKVFCIDVPEDRTVDDAWLTVKGVVVEEEPAIVLVEPTRSLKVVAGRLADRFGTSVVTDILSLNDNQADKMYFGGVGHRLCEVRGNIALYTVGAGVLGGVEEEKNAVVKKVDYLVPDGALTVVGESPLESCGTNLPAADVVVAGGRGFASKEELGLLDDLAHKIGGECGCTRPLAEGVDWMPRETYIGVSGLMLAPKVYVGVGVSGQMQHMVGCNRAATLFAINKDKNAPIFKMCDYGLVGDLNEALPALVAAL